MPALAFLVLLAVAGLVLVSLVVIDRSGVPSVSHHGYLPFTNQGRVAAPAPAPDTTSQEVLPAQPKSEPEHQPMIPAEKRSAHAKSESEHQATIPAEARAARAEAPSKKARVEASAKKARVEASAKKARAEATPPPDKPSTRPTTYHLRQIFHQGLLISTLTSDERCGPQPRPMSALGQKQTCAAH